MKQYTLNLLFLYLREIFQSIEEYSLLRPSSNQAHGPIFVPLVLEDFGKNKSLKTFLKLFQPKTFSSKGNRVPNTLEEQIIEIKDYFTLAGYNLVAQCIMGRAKLLRLAKLWWKLNCQSRGVSEEIQDEKS